MQADKFGVLNLSLMSLREALPDCDRYSLDWIRAGNIQPNYREQVVQIFQRLGCRLL